MPTRIPPPCHDQTPETFRAWVLANPPTPGDSLALRTEYGGGVYYQAVEVEHYRPGKKGRGVIHTNQGRFYDDGASCRHPKGHMRLLRRITPAISQALAARTTFWLY